MYPELRAGGGTNCGRIHRGPYLGQRDFPRQGIVEDMKEKAFLHYPVNKVCLETAPSTHTETLTLNAGGLCRRWMDFEKIETTFFTAL